MFNRMQETERALSDLETQHNLTERSSVSATSPIATSPAEKEIIGLSEQIRSLRRETEQLRRQQHDIMQAVTDAPPPMYVEGSSESDHDAVR
jgi:predicted  nucleic acid-binding Zn-ribbon protein